MTDHDKIREAVRAGRVRPCDCRSRSGWNPLGHQHGCSMRADLETAIGPKDPTDPPVTLIERTRYAIEHGNSDRLHAELLTELERLHDLIRRGLAHGDQFRSPYAAGARAELRITAGMPAPKGSS